MQIQGIYDGDWSDKPRLAVRIDGRRLGTYPSQRVWNHSPDGFNWGYNGSGPAQLALAILLAAGLSRERAVALHQRFKRDHVAYWPAGANFSVEIDIAQWADATMTAQQTTPRTPDRRPIEGGDS